MHFGLRIASTFTRPLLVVAAALAAWALATAAWSQSSSSSAEPASSSALASSSVAPVESLPPAAEGASLLIAVVLFALVIGGGGLALRWFMSERQHDKPDYKPEELKVFNSTRVVARVTASFAVAGLLIVVALCFGLARGDAWIFLSYLGTDILVAGAATAAGALGGFIFGIPRTREAIDRADAEAKGVEDVTDKGQRSKAVLLANTNLERISDWLTTLLIGATLVQLRDLPHWLVQVGNTLGDGLKNENVIPFILIFFFGLGFLGIYLVTRLYLTVTFWQTLDMVSGGDGAGATRSATRASPDLAGAKARLDSALAADAAAQLGAVRYLDTAGIPPDQAGDPEFSLKLARALLKLLAANAADDPARRKQDLRTVVGVVATDANTAAQLRDDLANNGYGSGDAALDAELTATLGG